MDNWIYIALMAVIVMIFIRWRNRASVVVMGTKSVKPYGAFHCVHIRYPATACMAVKKLTNERFLASEAPSLPVPGCTAGRCECSFVHHDDRRDDTLERREFHTLKTQVFPEEKNKRALSSDRRDETE